MQPADMQEGLNMDRASAGFESIAEMLLQQKKLMDALEAENRELRRQLAELRRGIGIAVVIEGKTIQLASGTADPAFQNGLAALGQSPAANQINQLNNQISQLNLGAVSGGFGGMTPPPTPATSSPLFASERPATNGSGNNNGRNPLADSFVL
jgi:hypothetical protein